MGTRAEKRMRRRYNRGESRLRRYYRSVRADEHRRAQRARVMWGRLSRLWVGDPDQRARKRVARDLAQRNLLPPHIAYAIRAHRWPRWIAWARTPIAAVRERQLKRRWAARLVEGIS